MRTISGLLSPMWVASDFYHRLGFELGILADAGSLTSGKNDCFHWINLLNE